MNKLAAGCVKTILEKHTDSMVDMIKKAAKNEWEKFKVDFDIVFRKYLENSYDKYSKIKTLLYKTEPKFIYDFFEVPCLTREHMEPVKADDVNNLLDISKYIIIQGTGGIGKSTLLKHLFINELEKKDLIPVFIELKDINDMSENYKMEDIIFEKLDNLGSSLNKNYLEYALQSGCFLFLLDGYDEIVTNKKDYFFRQLDAFCDKYSNNYYVVSSRPYSEFVEFQRFTILTTSPLSKEQAISLVNRLDFDEEVKCRFMKALDEVLYEAHESFASNPLLLNIMLLTYDNYAEIPEKLHLFYSNAFETLYAKHDATKAGYKREMRSALPYDSFKKVFAYFCFMSYVQGKIEFTYDDLVANLKRIPQNKIQFEIDDYIFDLVNSLCVLFREGLNFKFAHRSFQEYFTALFLKELADESMKQLGMDLIKRDISRVSHDSVFDMLYDMAEDRFEQNIFLPILDEYEQNAVGKDKYDFYFEKLIKRIKITKKGKTRNYKLWLSIDFDQDMIEFIYRYTFYYVNRTEARNKKVQAATNRLFKYLKENKKYRVGGYIWSKRKF